MSTSLWYFCMILNGNAVEKSRSAVTSCIKVFDLSYFCLLNALGIIEIPYNASFRHKRQLYLSILKEFGFGQRLMETRINVEVAEFVRQARLKDGQPFDPSNLMHTCVLNVIISILVGRRYTYGHPNLVHLNECICNAFKGIVQELEIFPILQYVPPFRSRLQKFRNLVQLVSDAVGNEVMNYFLLYIAAW
jgi:hypothetical protein